MFVVWDSGRHLRQDVLTDLQTRFRIIGVHEVIWSDGMWFANYQRFYSDLELRGVYHQLNKGKGPLLVVVVEDPNPVYDYRETGRGKREVNTRFFDAKSLYRTWSDRNGVHCGENSAETFRDLAMLLGTQYEARLREESLESTNNIVRVQRDTTGARGWSSLAELFDILNLAVEYVAIRYDRMVPDDPELSAAPIEIITADPYAVHTILSSGAYVPVRSRAGGYVEVAVAGESRRVGIRSPGDHYLDDAWMRRLLEMRSRDADGVYAPADGEEFWLLAYHCAVHGAKLSTPVRQQLRHLAPIATPTLDADLFNDKADQVKILQVLVECLRARNLDFPVPLDIAVGYGSAASRPGILNTSLVSRTRRRAASALWKTRARLETVYYWLRDHFLSAAPWLGDLKRVLSPARPAANDMNHAGNS